VRPGLVEDGIAGAKLGAAGPGGVEGPGISEGRDIRNELQKSSTTSREASCRSNLMMKMVHFTIQQVRAREIDQQMIGQKRTIPTPAEAKSGAEIQLSPGELEKPPQSSGGGLPGTSGVPLLRGATSAPQATWRRTGSRSSDEQSPQSRPGCRNKKIDQQMIGQKRNAPAPAGAESGAENQLSPGELETGAGFGGGLPTQGRDLLEGRDPGSAGDPSAGELSSDEKSPLSSRYRFAAAQKADP